MQIISHTHTHTKSHQFSVRSHYPAGSMTEVASHSFSMNWNSCYDTATTLMKLLFYSFVSIGYTSLTIALRKANLPLLRKPSGLGDWMSFILDWVLISLSIGIPLIWWWFGKKNTIVVFIVAQTMSAFVGIYRIWINLGPSRFLLIFGALSQLCSIVGAVPVNLLMQDTGSQFLHGILGLLFVLNEIGIGYCIYIVIDHPAAKVEEIPLIL